MGSLGQVAGRCRTGRWLLALCVSLAHAPGAAAAETVRINGAGSSLDLMKVLLQRWAPSHPEVLVEMSAPLGSAGALRALQAGAIDLAVVGRPLQAAEGAWGAAAIRYGRSPLLVVGHKQVQQANVTNAELEDLYSGRRVRWGDGAPVRIVLRPENETNTRILNGLSPGMERATAVARRQPWAQVAVTDPESNEMVATTPGALGMATLTSVLVEGRPLRVLSLNGVAGSVETLAQGRYPLAKDIIFVVGTNPSAAVRAILDYAFSPEGRARAAAVGVLVEDRGAGR